MKCFSLSCLHALVVYFFLPHSQVFSLSSSTPSTPLCRPDESSALLQFKASFQIAATASSRPMYAKTASWNESTNCCEYWDGVWCDAATGHVMVLNLDRSRLKGTIRSDSSLFSLRHLEILSLSGNDFGGSAVLPEFGKFKNMAFLDLSYSNFSGDIPVEIAHLSKLSDLVLAADFGDEKLRIGGATFTALALNLTDLGYLLLGNVEMSSVSLDSMANLSSSMTWLMMLSCELNGELPDRTFSRFPNLEELDLRGNNLRGRIPWSSFLNVELITLLDLSKNNFTGQIPELFGNFSSNYSSVFASRLTSISLSNNSLEGVIPSWMFKPPSLSILDLSSNHFTGKLVDDFYATSSLTFLSLANNKLQGVIPSSIFKNLNLSFLDLSSNNFTCNLELRELSKLKKLSFLSLSSNNLSLDFNTSITSLSWKTLQILDLSSNSFSGRLPIFSSLLLRVFFASNNQFSGAIPTSICKIKSLKFLDVSDNNLTGRIPECIGSFSQNLSLLNLRRNKLQGMIPLTFSNKNILRNLNLNGNALEGPLPRSLMFCRSLEVLDLGNNRLQDTFPDWLESLPELRVLILSDNMFHGPIGNPIISKSPFPELRIIDLSHNGFSGALPAKYFECLKAMMMNAEKEHKIKYMGDDYYTDTVTVTMKGHDVELVKIQTIFTAIDLSSNNFTGEIPELIGKLKSLKGLILSHNMLKETIPSSLGNLTNLEGLDLSSNQLVGTIPSELLDITSLAFLNLSRNHLVGPIPQGKQFNTFSNESFLENSGLCGFPLIEKCGDRRTDLEPSSPTSEQEGSSITNGFNWKIVLMGFASGFVIGISIGYMLLYSDGRLSWLCKRIEEELKQKIKVWQTEKREKARALRIARQ